MRCDAKSKNSFMTAKRWIHSKAYVFVTYIQGCRAMGLDVDVNKRRGGACCHANFITNNQIS
jgi:hypothetical protein